MNNSERIEVPVVDPSGCPRPRRCGERRDFLANCASGLAPSTATTNRGGAPEAGARAKKERAAKRMPTFRNPETLYQLQVAIRLRQHWKIKHQGRPALTARPLISVNRGLKAGQPLIDGLPATMLTTSVRDPRDTRACARAKRANCPVPASSGLAKATPCASSAAGPSTALKPEAAPGSTLFSADNVKTGQVQAALLPIYRLHEGHTGPVAAKVAAPAGNASGLFARTCVHDDIFGASFGPARQEAGRARRRISALTLGNRRAACNVPRACVEG